MSVKYCEFCNLYVNKMLWNKHEKKSEHVKNFNSSNKCIQCNKLCKYYLEDNKICKECFVKNKKLCNICELYKTDAIWREDFNKIFCNECYSTYKYDELLESRRYTIELLLKLERQITEIKNELINLDIYRKICDIEYRLQNLESKNDSIQRLLGTKSDKSPYDNKSSNNKSFYNISPNNKSPNNISPNNISPSNKSPNNKSHKKYRKLMSYDNIFSKRISHILSPKRKKL